MNDKPVLICYDGSDGARRAITAAADLLSARRAVVLAVGPPLPPDERWVERTSPIVPDRQEENAEAALERARTGADHARRAGFEAVARSEIAAPTWKGIVDCANEIDAAVIVVGSHGRHGGDELLHGSVSHRVAAHAGRPVLIVPPSRD